MSSLRQRMPFVLGLTLLVAVGCYLLGCHRPTTNLAVSGTVEATQAELGFPVGGRIVEILVREGDSVRAGQPLARLDTVESAARLSQLRAQAEAARALLLELTNGTRPEELEQARAGLTAADRAMADAESDLARAKTLAATNVVSRQSLDKAQVAYDLAYTRQAQARAQLQLLESGPRKERIAAQRAQVAMAEAQVRSMEAALANFTLRPAFDGLVSARQHEPGETVGPGAPVLTVLDPSDRWVRIYVPEPRIGAVHLGAEAGIRSDTYPDQRYAGRVSYIAQEAEFTPRNVQTAEERVKLVYAVKVRITGDPTFVLKPGMPVDVELQLAGRPR